MNNQTLKQNDFYLLVGPASLSVQSGEVEVIAAGIKAGQTLEVPSGKRVPVKAISDASLELKAPPESFSKMETSSIPEEWDNLAGRIASGHIMGRLYNVMVLGEVDTGKTFFCTYLANRLIEKKKRIGVLDCDTGQSDIGPPGAFGMLVMNSPTVFLSEEPATHLYMLGAHSPGLHFLPAMTGLSYMLEKARAGVDVLIIDTTGWVQGDGGRALKKAKLDFIKPDLVVLMQRGNELEHLVKHLPSSKVVRLPVSKKASPTSQMERKSLRELVSKRYFKNSRVFEIPFKQIITDRCYFLSGTPLPLEGTLHSERLSGWEGTLVISSGPLLMEMTKGWPKDLGRIMNFVSGHEKGLLIAFLDENQDVLALGRLEEIDFLNNCFRVRAPFPGDLNSIKCIQFGSVKVTENGEEAGFLEPGSF
ncbi:hypothetical protein HYY75_03975 [bacterium]|nr:hypothetical protein [bacterium]